MTKNPNEFYFKMINTELKDGVHQCQENAAPAYTDEQLRLIATQDIKYIQYKRQLELRKIEKLRSSLHLIDTAQDVRPNSHKIFVDTRQEKKEFDASKYFGGQELEETGPYERRSTRLSHLPQVVLPSGGDDTGKKESAKSAYRELQSRLKRVEQLTIVLEKMQTKKRLMGEKNDKNARARIGKKGLPKLVAPETVDNAAIYRWPTKRQK